MQKLDSEGLVRIVEKSDGPLFLARGERFTYARMPEGTRVLYPRPPLPGMKIPELRAKVREALENPLGMDPLRAFLKPGAKVTIAVDDISLSLPKQAHDVRRTCTEVVLEYLAEHGVSDIEIVIAVCLHRHMHDWEVREMLGPKVFNAYWPQKKLYNYDAEDPDGNVVLGHDRHGHVVEIHRRSAESDVVIYVNLNLIALNGGHKSVGVGLATYRCIRPNHSAEAQLHSRSFNDPPRSRMHQVIDHIGRYVESKVKVFHIEMTVNNDTFPWFIGYMQKPEPEWNLVDKLAARVNKHFLDCTPLSVNRGIFFGVHAPYACTGVTAGECEAVHAVTLRNVYRQQLVELQGQSDILVSPIAYVMPYSVHSVMNPILVYAMGLGYNFNFYKGQPVLKKGGTLILNHPMENKFDAVHHPSYIELYEKLAETADPAKVDAWSDYFAEKPEYIEKYRFRNAYHGFHAISMWNWGCHGMDHCGQVIVVAPEDPEPARRFGWEVAGSVEEAIAMGRAKHGAGASVSVSHAPPIAMWDVK
ncbi:MAG: nickel-dependent lactate racemase [Planctomycetota bacterium]|nr:nickel-dependent lactate racemase [Planctomycetota bacterium]